MAATPDIDALVLEGQRLRQVNPRALLQHAELLQRAAGDNALTGGYAEVFAAWGLLAHGERPAAELALARARTLMAHSGDLEGQLTCRGLQADLFIRDGRLLEALEIARVTLAQPEDTLSVWERYRAHARRTTALERLDEHDAALRAHYETLAMTRRSNEPALLANALGGVGGLQSSLLNLVDAITLCDEAWALCEHTDWHGVVQLVGTNRLGVLSGLGRHDEAVAMAEALIAREPLFPSRYRDVRHGLYALVLARAGHYERAQAQLDLARAGVPRDAVESSGWVWIQATVFNRTGRPRDALRLLAPFVQGDGKRLASGEFPVDRAHLFAEAALAYEALGDFAVALAHERCAAAAREQAAAQAAHARRLTLQIDLELDAAHRARDQATREQQRLAELNTELEAANAAKTRFLAAASHDLRQPVQALAMYMAALQREPSAPARNDLMTRMNQSLQALGSLFDVLLDVSRLDAGLVPVHPAPLRLDDLLRRLVDEYMLLAQQRNLRLRLRLPPEAAATVSDAVLLEGCLRNLLDNAIKYTARGGVVVRLRPNAAGWRVEVRDTGIGIDATVQAQVFHEFFQVGNEERDRSKGLGLGLSIVKRTAALLGHPLGLRSRAGRGSCFYIDVPRQAVMATDAAAVAAHGAEPTALGLIVIDDDASVRDSLGALLERWGHRVMEGSDAPEALLQWQQLGCPAVDAAIIDLRLRGGRTGLQAIAELRAGIGAAVPALVITGDIAPSRLRLLADAGQPWLPKPLMPMRLRSWLQALAPTPSAETALGPLASRSGTR
jgi:signal transduction histidine kinase/CheY-like chemotaxis protein